MVRKSILAVMAMVCAAPLAAQEQTPAPRAERGCDALVDSGDGVQIVPDRQFSIIGRDWDDAPPLDLPGGAAVRCMRSTIVPHENDWLVLQAGHALYLVEDEQEVPRISVLETSGGQVRFRMARGTLTDAERDQLAKRLREFQQLGPGAAAREDVADGEARAGDFRVVQLWTDDPDGFLAAWAGPTPPRLDTTTRGKRGEVLRQFVIFDGCKPDSSGNCQLAARFEFYRPDGSRDDDDIDFVLWDDEAPPSGRLSLSPHGAGVVIGDGDPLGDYEARLVVTDAVAGVTATSSVNLTFSETGS